MPAFQDMIDAQKKAIADAEAAEQNELEVVEAAAAEQVRQTELSACVEAAYLIASADGHTSTEEVNHIASKMCDLTEHAFDKAHVEALIDLARQYVEAEGREARIASLATTVEGEDKRQAAFMVAAATSWTGGGIGMKEGLALQAIARAFGWDINHMHKLLGKARA
ncbi:MAG TPA: hypothetical protein ENK23_07640 [Sorangium sp.]|nr:hypothetical protein [Sorangium sp.]